ncbi:MAG: adenylosuccinate synthase, partial [Phycisphaeraceae bacterium]|nr:adenylosuccinate synthase [Phycisphaeraceae bacterium]
REDAAKKAGSMFGTTRRGIGPCVSDKVCYHGLRVCDLAYPDDFETRVRAEIALKNRIIVEVHGAEPLDADAMVEQLRKQSARLAPYVVDSVSLLHEGRAAGDKNLFEGAQAALLDVDFGTYPFVTSSNTGAGGAPSGSGIPPNAIDRVVGIVKAYTTRVGGGPFPTELTDDMGAHIAKV